MDSIPKGKHRSLVGPQETVRKEVHAVWRSLHSRSYETDGICEQQGRFTNSKYYNAPTQHKLKCYWQLETQY
jgi:hypothetical protein